MRQVELIQYEMGNLLLKMEQIGDIVEKQLEYQYIELNGTPELLEAVILQDEEKEEIDKNFIHKDFDFAASKQHANDTIRNFQLVENGYLTAWKALNNIEYEEVANPELTVDNTGTGSIETFPYYNTDGVTYLNGYHVDHPTPGKNAIMYDPQTNDEQDIRLDALHLMPQDPVYRQLNNAYRDAAMNTIINGQLTDVLYDARFNQAVDRGALSMNYLVDRTINPDVLPEEYWIDPFEDYFNNESDGFLRAMLILGIGKNAKERNKYLTDRRYPNEKLRREIKNREWNRPLMSYVDAIKQYLETGKAPDYLRNNIALPEVVVNPHNNGGKVNLFREAGPVIRPTWNQFQQQYLDYFTQQNEEFLKQLEDVREYNSLYGKNQYYDWKDFGGYEPKYVLTLPSGLKVYDAPGTKLKQFYPEVDFPRPQYFVIPNKYGQYSYIPQDGYVSQAISYYRGEKPSGELEGADELRRLLNQITVQQSDNTSLYNTAAPTLTKPTTFSSTLPDNRYEGASIGPDNRTAYERGIARNRGELELWNLNVYQPRKELELKTASLVGWVDPLRHIGNAVNMVNGEYDNYVEGMSSPKNHGVWSLFGPEGNNFAANYPLLDFTGNLVAGYFGTKAIPKITSGIGNVRTYLYNNAVPFLSEGRWVRNLPTDAVAWRGGYGNANIRQARTTGQVRNLGTFKSPHFQWGSEGYKEVFTPSEMKGLSLIADESGRTQYVPVDMSGNPKGSPNFDPTMYVEGEVTPLPFNSADASNFNVYKPIFGNPKLGYWKSRLAKPSSTTNTASSILGDTQPYKSNYSYVDQFENVLNLSKKDGIHRMLRNEPLSDILKMALRGESVDILSMPLGLDEIFNAQVVSRLPKDVVTQYTPKPGRATRIGDYITKQNLIKFDEFLDFLKNGRYAKIDLGLMDRIQGKEGTGGYFDLDDKSIVIADDNGNTYRIADSELYRRLLHEARHKYDDMFGLPLEQLDILMEAYPEDWETFLETLPEDDPLRTYENMAYERVTTNADARRELLGSVNNWLMPVEEQNAFMETLPSFDVVEAVRASNGYGRRYIKYLEDKYNGEIPENIIENFRKAAMKVGAITGLATGLNTMTD